MTSSTFSRSVAEISSLDFNSTESLGKSTLPEDLIVARTSLLSTGMTCQYLPLSYLRICSSPLEKILVLRSKSNGGTGVIVSFMLKILTLPAD